MLIFSHRGASGYAPENTKASFRKALDLGSKTFEFDVQITKDNKYVVFHDFTLERTSTGKGKVLEKKLDELKKLDIGSWFNSEFSEEKILTLEELIDFLPKDSFLNIELKRHKEDKRFFGVDFINLIKPIKDRVLVSSFDWELLIHLNELEENINFGILIDSYYEDFIKDLKDLPFIPYSVNPNYKMINKAFMEEFQEYKIIAYTVNSYEEIQELETLGVYGVFCNYPDIRPKRRTLNPVIVNSI